MMSPIYDSNRRRRMNVTRLYVCGHSLPDIVEELGLSEKVVERELAEIRKQWVASALCGGTEAKARELTKLDHTESEAWRAWELSQKDFSRTKKTEKKEGESCETITETRDGDPKFMAAAQRAIEMRLVIFGFIGSKKSKTAGDTEKGDSRFTKFLDEVAEDMARTANQATENQDAGNQDTAKEDRAHEDAAET